MNIKFMRFADMYFGIPICFILTLFQKIRIKLQKSTETHQLSKVLFIELPEMGSAVMSYPAIKKISKKIKKENIYFLIFKKNKDALKIFNILPEENIISISSETFLEFLCDSIKAVLFFRKQKIDTIFDLEIFTRYSIIFSFFINALRIAGFYIQENSGLYRGDILTHKVNYNYYSHIALNYFALVESVLNYDNYEFPLVKEEMNTDLFIPKIPTNEKIKYNLSSILQKYEIFFEEKSTKLFIISPHSGEIELRGWNYQNYYDLIKLVLENHKNCCVVLTGVKEAVLKNSELKEKVQNERCIDLTNKTNIYEFLELLNMGNVFLTNDGGAGHFAAATKIPSYIFFGPETPLMYKPLGENINIFYKNYNCSPCLSAFNYRLSKCTSNNCVNDFKVEYVYSTLKKYF